MPLHQAVLDIFGKFNALPYHGEADDIGYTVLFLASDESKFITGQTIQVEGGHYIANPSISDFNDYVTKAKSNKLSGHPYNKTLTWIRSTLSGVFS
ncbi:SDR family oxidoreductase [Peribacillus frigoritolerans]|nr:SDR family oxidoreductase [Peribacillus frigoritolerans]